MGEEQEEQGSELPAEQGNGGNNPVADTGKKIADRLGDRGKKDALKNSALKGKLAAAMGPIIFWTAVVIVAIIIIVGIIMFFETMPGMVMEKIKAIGKKIMEDVSNYWGKDIAELSIKPKDVYSSLSYLDEMGYDLKGDGFLTDYYEDNNVDERIKKDYDIRDVPSHHLDDGIIRKDEDNSVLLAKSDFILSYLISDNYVYTLRNDNMVTDSFWSALGQRLKWWVGFPLDKKFTKGMIGIYTESSVGVANNSLYDYNRWHNTDHVEINPSSKKMKIKKGNGLFGRAVTMEYDIDGWTGRYGMPIDFLTAVHLATLMPDLAYDMQDSFDTEVKIVLHSYTVTYEYFYKTESGNYATVDELSAAYSTIDNLLPQITLEEVTGTDEESTAAAISEILENNKEALDDTLGKLEMTYENGEDLRNIWEKIQGILGEIGSLPTSETYYVPYISKVENHWYRDVYYAIKKDGASKNLVRYDADYEKLYNERWTLYEVDSDNNYKLYALNDDGDYAKSTDEIKNYSPELFEQEGEYFLFKGSEEEQRESLQNVDSSKSRYNVAKKAQVLDTSNEDVFEDIGWSDNGHSYWSAYTAESNSTSSGYTQVPNKTSIFYKATGNSVIKQTGEGQRVETNPEIKKMFLTNTYFRYQGDPTTAEVITALRKKLIDIVGEKNQYGPLNELGPDKKDVTDLVYSKTELGLDGDYGADEFKISDYSGQVVINQQSLDAFNMLENTHTLDSDYIYRDFKELVVELGYFKKEELTDETPRLLEFLTPEVGSAGYPNRQIDKKENEYGTMIHSEGDIKALARAESEEIETDNGDGRETDPTTR